MPYEPENPQKPPAKPKLPLSSRPSKASGNIVALAAILSLLVAFFNLYVSWPLGVPPEFPLFLSLALVFGALWWTIRKTNNARRPARPAAKPDKYEH